ncbi:MAG: response regulator transcription factor [Fermentimonas sp.]|nr:response regulator transcription factor [Fermentimonas sp.]NLC86605.1 response regulator transcription factor [Bacteroidales bacterium]MDD2930315.1 response regulator transcription factor [Fermentimonas sp.]MDD3188019.1 response regulator transcription factor [Fermentimonas sp.]MDD3511812.1 response regulator transcription factor [Fermentimonas sp.]
MMKERILVVDDEKDICDILQFNLENEGYIVDVANSGEEAMEMLTDVHQLIILDVMMDGISGFKMAEMLRKNENYVPIIFLTAKNTENDVLTGFSLGGDDYIAKPFSVKEVLARVRALIKRTSLIIQPADTKWKHDGLKIDITTNRVTIDDNEVSLTKKEFEILSLLAQASPKVLTRAEILSSVWGDNEYVLDRTVDVHITRLRKKLGDYANVIVNRSGFGYYLNLNDNSENE